MKRPHPMMKALPALILPALLALLLAPAVAAAAPAVHVVTHITPKPATPNVLRAGQSISLSLSYVSPEPTGVRILVQPMTGGKPAAGWSAPDSPVYPAGSGTATRSFKITKGDVTVNRIRIQMWNAAETVRLQQVVIPVHYRFTKAKANVIHGLTMTPVPNILKHKQKVRVDFKYRTNQRAGVRILVRPLTGKALTPRSAAHASRVYKGSGSGSGWFTVTGGTPAIDKVRVQMWNRAKTKRLFNAVVPVHYRYRMPTNVVDSIEFGIPSPNVLRLDQDLEVRFRYTTDHEDGVWIFVRPMTNGERTPNYAVSPPSLHPYRAGIGTGHFTIKSEAAEVDEIDITMMTPDLTTMLFRARIPVSFRFVVEHDHHRPQAHWDLGRCTERPACAPRRAAASVRASRDERERYAARRLVRRREGCTLSTRLEHLRHLTALLVALALMTVGLLAAPVRSYADPIQPAPPSHPQTTLVVLVDFNDIQMQKTDEFWHDRVFSLDVDSVNRYYNETTYGTHQFLPAAETYEVANDGVVHVTLARNHPDAGRDTWAVSRCVIDAVTAADPHVDFAAFDANGDGVLDSDELHLAVVLAGYEASDSRAARPSIWAHANLGGLSWQDCRPDGVQLTTYIAQGELISQEVGPNGIGTVAHELGHCLGLPDLYDTTGASIGLGTSSLMANGAGLSCGETMDGSSPAHLDPWSLIQIGAREPQVVTEDATVTLYGSTTPDYNIVKVPITDDGSQYFLLENRITEGYDRGLRDDRSRGGAASGVAIYHVDEWVIDVWDTAIYGTNRGVNSNYLRKAVDLEESDGPALDLPWDSPQGGDHYFYEGHHTVFGPETYPDTGAYVDTLTNGTTRPTGIRIVIEGESGDERMKAHITFGSTATAESFAGGDGSYARPYQIATKTQLDMVRRHPDAHFVLVDDLEFTGADFEAGGAFYNRGKGFRPLFGSGTFRGSFDGAGHSITGLRIDASGTADIYAGLFGTLQGTVKNLDLVEATVSATSTNGVSHAGGIAGRVQEGLLSGCSVSGSVTADWAGGIVGHARGTAIRGCRNRAAVESQALDLWGNAGGIAGEAFRTTISTCGNEGDVTAECQLTATPEPNGYPGLVAVGGIVGRLGGHGCKAGITRCFNTGRITALNWMDYPWCSVPSAGGIVGRVDGGRPATVADCYNTGLVSTSYMGGGIVGDVGKASAPSIARCYSVGDFQSTAVGDYRGQSGGVVGRVQSEYDDVITDCLFLATDACPDGVNRWGGDGPPPAQDPTTPCTDEEMQAQERYDGFDFDDVWVLAGASGYPYPQLRAQRQVLEQPGAPTVTAVANGYDGVKLTWSAVTGATGYEVYRALDTGGPWGLIAATSADRRSLTDTGLATGTAYHYRVCAVTTEGGLTVRGADSEPATATPALANGAGLKLKKASATSVRASWKAVPGATGYQLWRAKAAKGKYVLAKTTGKLTVTDLKLARKAPHFYKVRAYRLVGGVRVFGEWSPVAKIKL